MSEHSGPDELQALCEAAVEGRLTPEQGQQLEQLVLSSADARRFYAEYVHQHASLHWSVAEASFQRSEQGQLANSQDSSTSSVSTDSEPTHLPFRPRTRWIRWVTAAAAVILVSLGFWYVSQPPRTLATLVRAEGCTWAAGTLPTETGSRLGPGRLRLAEGLARIVFDNGAELNLEAPASVELVSAKMCKVHSGRLVARVPSAAKGFKFITPTAELIDLGTEFGVHVGEKTGSADVQVFKGRVDVRHFGSAQMQAMRTGQNLRFSQGGIRPFDPDSEILANATPVKPGQRILHISTALGKGKDAYVQQGKAPPEKRSSILLLVKRTVRRWSNWDRKAYIGLDLSLLDNQRVVEAELSLTFAPSEIGYASEVPDATFVIYGLTDESLDNWDENTIDWDNAPANHSGGDQVVANKVVRLGTFEIAQGQIKGTRTIKGAELVKFLNKDTNKLATFILVRETRGSGWSDLVHAFASRRHPDLPPPTLKLTVSPK